MSDRKATVVAEGFTFTEGPRWYGGELYFVDFYTNSVNVVRSDGTVEQVAHVPNQPSGLGWLPDGRMLVVSMTDHKVMRREPDGTLVEHADIASLCTGYANDMVVASNGQAYIGHFGFDLMGGADYEVASIILVNPDGSAQTVADNMAFPNGMVITPDNVLIANELFGNRVSAFDIQADGTLGPRRDFAAYGDLGDEKSWATRVENSTIIPDGLTLDAEGAIWVADCAHQRAVRIAEGGKFLDEVSTAPNGVFAVGLGGEDGKTLFLCVAPDFDQTARSAAREARVDSVRVDVPHAGTP